MFASNPTTKQPRIVCSVVLQDLNDDDLGDVEASWDAAADRGDFVALLFPRLRYAHEIASVLAVLARAERWRLARAEWGRVERAEDGPLSVHWLTKEGHRSPAMGTAPLGSMPVTRRAPYVALVVWPGSHANPRRQSKEGVGFVDGEHRLGDAAYDKAWSATRTEVRRQLGDPPDDAEALRDVAFILPKVITEAVFEALPPTTSAVSL